MSWNPKYIILILSTTLVSYISALLIEKQRSHTGKKLILAVALILCLGTLFFFKYFNFFSENIVAVFNLFSLKLHPVTLNLILPVGISFYTFQTLGYVIDVYRGGVKAERHLGTYAVFISYFPQLVARPIERSENLLHQIKEEKIFNYENATYGLKLMAWGFFKKLAIADVLAQYVDAAYASLPTCTGFDLVCAILLFTFQIYCDFSGYSDIAIGTSKLLGIELMTNFKSPYFSGSIKEFWNRWHISLSTWFRDYVYIPLGGNRCSKVRHCLNLMITFLISGLWHGASWTYVIWGGIHGAALSIESLIHTKSDKIGRLKKVVSTLLVFIFCNFAWIFFRAESFEDALFVITHIFIYLRTPGTFLENDINMSVIDLIKIIITLLILAIYDYSAMKIDVIDYISNKKPIFRWFIYFLLIWAILFFMKVATSSEFVYFQF